MTTEEKFRAAVNVIRSLPKNGSYQPSADLMLRFYAYYKQATEGPCKSSRPGFWEMIKKAKWDAWNRLGNMPREKAMENYVEELKKIVETMSYTENVAQFLESLDSFYERVPQEDLNLLVGNIVERVVGGSGESSPLRPSSPNHSPNHTAAALAARFGSSLETSPASSCYSPSPQPPGSSDQETEDEDEFIDTIEEGVGSAVNMNGTHGVEGIKHNSIHSPTRTHSKQLLKENGFDANHNHPDIMNSQKPHTYTIRDQNGDQYMNGIGGDGIHSNSIGKTVLKSKVIPNGDIRKPNQEGKKVVDLVGGRPPSRMVNGFSDSNATNGLSYSDTDIVEIEEHTATMQIKQLVMDMQNDLDLIRSRLRNLEKFSSSKNKGTDSLVLSSRKNVPAWWPLPELSPRTTALIVLWPFVAHFIISYFSRRTRSRP